MAYRHYAMQAKARKDFEALMQCYPLTTDNLDGEIWRDSIEGYQISNFGRLKKIYKSVERIRKPTITHCYLVFQIHRKEQSKWYSAHRLAAQAFIPNPANKPFVNHIDGNKFNNHISNLEWVTQSENVQHAYDIGLTPSGAARSDSKLTDELIEWCRDVYIPRDPTFGACALARLLGVSEKLIRDAVHGKSYKLANGTIHPNFDSRVPESVRNEIRRLHVKGSKEFGVRALAKRFNLNECTVRDIVKHPNR